MTQVKEDSLLVEGMRSYPKALGALNEFGDLVISRIQEVVADELGSLSTAVGVSFAQDDLGPYRRPNRLGGLDPKNISLGIKIDRIAKSGWALFFVLWWWNGEVRPSVSIWLKDHDLAESTFTALRKFQSRTPMELDSGHEISLSRALAPDNAERLPEILRELIQEFSDLWSKAGGLGSLQNRTV